MTCEIDRTSRSPRFSTASYVLSFIPQSSSLPENFFVLSLSFPTSRTPSSHFSLPVNVLTAYVTEKAWPPPRVDPCPCVSVHVVAVRVSECPRLPKASLCALTVPGAHMLRDLSLAVVPFPLASPVFPPTGSFSSRYQHAVIFPVVVVVIRVNTERHLSTLQPPPNAFPFLCLCLQQKSQELSVYTVVSTFFS